MKILSIPGRTIEFHEPGDLGLIEAESCQPLRLGLEQPVEIIRMLAGNVEEIPLTRYAAVNTSTGQQMPAVVEFVILPVGSAIERGHVWRLRSLLSSGVYSLR